MEINRLGNDAVALGAANYIAKDIKEKLPAQQIYSIAFSGGGTPQEMLDHLSKTDIPWEKVHIFQVDERVAPDGSNERNATQLTNHLVARVNIPEENIHLMPVEQTDLSAASVNYAASIHRVTNGQPLDLVHLGLGNDGHTASLPPGSDILEVNEKDVWFVDQFNGLARMTLTLPCINRSKKIFWLVSGEDKSSMLERMIKKDRSIPAGLINQEKAVVYTNIPADSGLGDSSGLD